MITLGRAKEEDAKRLTEVCIEAFRYDIALYGFGPEGYDSEESHIEYMRMADYYCVLRDNKEIAGGICVIKHGDDQAEIGIIYIHPELQGTGLGRQVLALIEQQYPTVIRWTLEAGHLSFKNQHFYERAGFVRVGTSEAGENGFYNIRYEKRMTH